MKETNIFELLKDPYHLPNKPKLFEAFAGVGMQRMAFNRLGIDYEMVGISEIDKYAINSYIKIHGETKNFGNICDVKGYELPNIDVFTWSFPCTDLSKAGQQKGLSKDTRSGLVYEVLRILNEAQKVDNLPKVLIMENVVDLIQSKFIKQFQEIQLKLEELGYTNYVETLNAKNYGVAQNRDRVFMVSILGDYYYEFPKPIQLEKKLKDYLEVDVDEKYYLSQAMLNYCTDMTDRNGFVRGNRFKPQEKNANYAFAITTSPGSRPVDNFIKEPLCLNSKVNGKQPSLQDRIYDSEAIATCVTTSFLPYVTVPEANEIVIGSGQKNAYKGSVENVSPTLTSAMGMGGGQTPMVTENNLTRIRKLTPLECWRLMGIDDSDYQKAQSVSSNAQLYKQAGNGIVVDVFAEIVKKLL